MQIKCWKSDLGGASEDVLSSLIQMHPHGNCIPAREANVCFHKRRELFLLESFLSCLIPINKRVHGDNLNTDVFVKSVSFFLEINKLWHSSHLQLQGLGSLKARASAAMWTTDGKRSHPPRRSSRRTSQGQGRTCKWNAATSYDALRLHPPPRMTLKPLPLPGDVDLRPYLIPAVLS